MSSKELAELSRARKAEEKAQKRAAKKQESLNVLQQAELKRIEARKSATQYNTASGEFPVSKIDELIAEVCAEYAKHNHFPDDPQSYEKAVSTVGSTLPRVLDSGIMKWS